MDALTRLKEEYRAELPDKLRVISEALHAVIRSLSGGMAADWKQLEFVTHKFAGSSGTYGYKDLSLLARRLENAIADGSLPNKAARDAKAELESWFTEFKPLVEAESRSKEAA